MSFLVKMTIIITKTRYFEDRINPYPQAKKLRQNLQKSCACLAPLSKGLIAFLVRLRGSILSPKRILVIFRYVRKIAKSEY
jgi:hypothetical protein